MGPLSKGEYTQMTIAPLSLVALVAQALPGVEGTGMTFAEGSAVASALLSVIGIGVWVRSRSSKPK